MSVRKFRKRKRAGICFRTLSFVGVVRNLLHKHFASFHDVDARLETIGVVGHLDT